MGSGDPFPKDGPNSNDEAEADSGSPIQEAPLVNLAGPPVESPLGLKEASRHGNPRLICKTLSATAYKMEITESSVGPRKRLLRAA